MCTKNKGRGIKTRQMFAATEKEVLRKIVGKTKIRIKKYKTIILSIVLYSCEIWSLTLRCLKTGS